MIATIAMFTLIFVLLVLVGSWAICGICGWNAESERAGAIHTDRATRPTKGTT